MKKNITILVANCGKSLIEETLVVETEEPQGRVLIVETVDTLIVETEETQEQHNSPHTCTVFS